MTKEKSESLDAVELRKMFKPLKNVELLGVFCIDKFRGKAPLMVYRYMRYAWAKNLIESKEISFADPKIWEDPFEKRFACGKYDGFTPRQLACLCVTTEHGENEAAFWRAFDPDGKHDLVQVTLDFEILLKSLDKFAKEYGAKVYVKACDYKYTSAELKSSGKDSFLDGVEKVDEKTFIDLMSLKRRAFASENELRIFIYGDNLPFEDGYVNIPYEGRLVRTIKVCPNPDIWAFMSAEDIVPKVLESYYRRKKIPVDIEQSRLYEGVSKFNFKKGKK